jgi:predicted PurR-regulated permease PerM
MLGFDRRAARYAWTAAAVLLLLALLYAVLKTIFIFVLAVLLAYLLAPLVNLLDRLLPASRTRTPALAVAYIIFVGTLVLAGFQIGSQVTEQASSFTKSLPDMLAKWEQPSAAAGPAVNSLREQIVARVRMEVTKRSTDLLSELPKAGIKLLSVASNLIYIVIVPVLAFFFLKDGYVVREHLLALVDEGPRRGLLDDVLADVHLLLAHYMRALVMLSIATFAAYAVTFSIMGVPYGVLLATVAMALEFIPTVGPLIAAVIIVLVAAAANSHIVGVLIFLVAYRMFQDYALSPYLMGHGVQLHPLLVLFGVFAGAELAGIPGSFLSVPVLALVRIVYLHIRKARLTTKRPAADSPIVEV